MVRRWISRSTIVACIGSLAVAAVVHSLAESIDSEPITPVPAAEALDPAKIELGQRMFHDVRLSRGDRVSCASCHDLARGGDDGRARSETSDGRPSDFNASTVFNAALNARLNWRGNFRTLTEQNEAVLLDPRLMNVTWDGAAGEAARRRGLSRGIQGALRRRARTRARSRCAGDVSALAAYARRPLRPLSARRTRCHHRRRGARLPAVQGLRLHCLPSGGECRRQPIPEIRCFL